MIVNGEEIDMAEEWPEGPVPFRLSVKGWLEVWDSREVTKDSAGKVRYGPNRGS